MRTKIVERERERERDLLRWFELVHTWSFYSPQIDFGTTHQNVSTVFRKSGLDDELQERNAL